MIGSTARRALFVVGIVGCAVGCGSDEEDSIAPPIVEDPDALDGGAPDASSEAFTVGGTVEGLEGSGLVLKNQGDTLAIAKGSSSFVFSKALGAGQSFEVTASAQPMLPAQTCVVANGSGVVSADVINVAVTCTTNTYPVHVTVLGLTGGGLVLTNNGGDELTVAAAGGASTKATFATQVASGQSFDVAIKSQPSGTPQQCEVSGGAGSVVAGDVVVTVNCSGLFTVGGTVSGLSGSGLVLKNAAAVELPVNANGGFTFAELLDTDADYAVTVKTQPTTPWQTCEIANGTGKVGTANVTSVDVACTTNTYAVGGTISGLEGTGLTLELGASTLSPAAGTSLFAFESVASGTPYPVRVTSQPTTPTQTCTVAQASGSVGGADVSDVAVQCTTHRYKLRVVANPTGTGLVLMNQVGEELAVAAAGTYDFEESVASGQPYLVTIKTQPSANETCSISSESGTVDDADVTVTVSCVGPKTVFVTSAAYKGDLGGIAGADTKCQASADAAGLSGTYYAWLSDEASSPSTRFSRSTTPYLLVDGTTVAANYTALVSGTLEHAIDMTEFGDEPSAEPIFGRPIAWSGTTESGQLQWSGQTCQSWTSALADQLATLANPLATTHWSFAWGGSPCDRESPLLCFEQ